MTRPRVKNMAASVHQRLLNLARDTGRPFNELLQYFAMERFLYRLSKSPYGDQFVLKGGLMLRVWQAPHSRPTKDIDLLGQIDNEVATVVAAIKDACTQEVETDGVTFDPDTVEGMRINIHAQHEGVRLRFQANLGKARVPMQVDVAFGDTVVPSEVVADYPTILDFPPPRVRAYSRESVIAEKVEAMVKLDVLSSRMNDLFDIWLLSREFDFDGRTLAEAIQTTFSRRGTVIPRQPVALGRGFAMIPGKQTQWQAFLRRSKLDGAPQRLQEVIRELAAFLQPITEALSAGRRFQGTWPAPGPWRGV